MNERRRGVLSRLALFGAAIVWGSSFFVIKGAVDYLPPATLQAVRFSVGALVLGAIFWKKVKRLTGSDWLRGLLVGAFLGAASLVQNVGIQDTTPGKNAFLTCVYCIIVPFMFWGVRGERPQAKRFVAAVLCLAGIGLVSLTQRLTIGRGDLLTLAGGVLYACHIVSVATAGEDMDPVALSVMQFASAALFSWIYALTFEGSPASFDWSVWPQVMYLALASTTLGYLLQVVGQKNAPPAAASLILSLESVFGVLFSVLFYGEQMTGRLVLGFAVIFLSVLISETDLTALPVFRRRGKGHEVASQGEKAAS